MKNFIYILFLGLIIFSTACEEFLEEMPRSTISPANFYQTSDDALAAVNAAYAGFQSDNYYGRYWITSSVHCGDGAYTRLYGSGDRNHIVNMIDDDVISNRRYNENLWTGIWEVVNRANAVLTNVPGIDMDATLQARILAEAKFIRALCYFNLVRRWGGVPIIITETSTSDLAALQVPKNTAAEVYDQIEKDLTEAMGVLPNIVEYDGNDVGRASKEAAQGLLAKAQLYQKDWGNARTNAVAVINSPSGLDLVPDPKDNWWLGGNPDNNEESIFEIQYNGISPQGHQLTNNFEPNNNGWGPGQWGSIHANLYFYNKFSDNDKRKEATFNMEHPDFVQRDTIVQWWEFRYQSPHINKHRDPDNPVSNGVANNVKVLRLADVLLVAAEATNESEGPANAYQYVNRVRTRAGLPDLAGLSQEQLRDSIYEEFRKELAYEGQDYEELVRTGKWISGKMASTDSTYWRAENLPPMYNDDGSLHTPDQDLLDRIIRYQPHVELFELDPWNVVWPFNQKALDKNPKLIQNPGYPGGPAWTGK